MATIRLKIYVPETREVEIKLPEDFPVGETEVVIEVPGKDETPWEESPWTKEELDEMLNFKGQTLGEILDSGLVGSGADWDIGDSEEWVQQQRRKEEQERHARWMHS